MTRGGITHALSIDVEEWFHIDALRPVLPRERWDGLQSRVELGLRALLDLLDLEEVRATFFVLGCVAERHRALIREIAHRGHEIACHGYDHELVTRQTPATFREEALRARSIIQDVTGAAVEGYRASTWSIRAETLWALPILAEVGFRFDSSFRTAAAARRAGLTEHGHFFRAALTGPLELVEFPASSIELPGLSLPCAGGGFLRLYPYWFTAAFLRRADHRGTPANVYIHPWELDPAHPRLAEGPVARFRTYVGLSGVGMKLGRLLQRFRFAPMGEVLGVCPRPERAAPVAASCA